MSTSLSMHHYYEVIPNNKKQVATYLIDIADFDADFNGANGDEYLWEESEGFESNAEYCLSVAQNEARPREMIEKFISLWMGRDPYYYDYDLGILVQDDKIFMSLAYMTRA